jgi:hypothetical protein
MHFGTLELWDVKLHFGTLFFSKMKHKSKVSLWDVGDELSNFLTEAVGGRKAAQPTPHEASAECKPTHADLHS